MWFLTTPFIQARRRRARNDRRRFLAARSQLLCASRHRSVERVMTDIGPADRATLHAIACRTLGMRQLRTRPYRPRINGKAVAGSYI
jgi:hypothetical protein